MTTNDAIEAASEHLAKALEQIANASVDYPEGSDEWLALSDVAEALQNLMRRLETNFGATS